MAAHELLRLKILLFQPDFQSEARSGLIIGAAARRNGADPIGCGAALKRGYSLDWSTARGGRQALTARR